jgi:hypothetical protein
MGGLDRDRLNEHAPVHLIIRELAWRVSADQHALRRVVLTWIGGMVNPVTDHGAGPRLYKTLEDA